jgi:hypothetical protein
MKKILYKEKGGEYQGMNIHSDMNVIEVKS